MAVSDIRETGRATQGVRLMRIAEGTKIVAVARAEQERKKTKRLKLPKPLKFRKKPTSRRWTL